MEQPKNTNNVNTHDTVYHQMDELDAMVYSNKYHEAINKAAGSKKTGIVLLCIGVVLTILSPIAFPFVYGANCESDAYGWCGFFVFLNLLPFLVVGIILTIVGIVKIVLSNRVLKNKTDIRRKPF